MTESNNERSSFIPCEVCDELVNAGEYSRHLSTCIANRLFRINFVIDDRVNSNGLLPEAESNNDPVLNNDTNDNDDENVESSSLGRSQTILQRRRGMNRELLVRTHNQLVTGANLREFTENHFGGFLRSAADSLGVVFVPLGNNSFNVAQITPDNEYEWNLALADRIGKVDVGIKDIDSISKFVPKPFDERSDDDICSICRDFLGGEEGLARELACTHQFCNECITHWLAKHTTCPLCVCDLSDFQEEKKEKN